MRNSLIVLVLVTAVAATAAAERPVIIGEHVETLLETPHPYPSSGSSEPMLTWVDEIAFPGATYIAVHFARLELAEGDVIVVRSPDGEQWYDYTLNGRAGLGATKEGFFATHVKGDTAVVELYTVGDETGHGYTIDLYGRGYNEDEIRHFWSIGLGEIMNLPEIPGEGESQCGAIDYENAVCYADTEPEIYSSARAVARMLLNGSAWCTAWLVGDAGHIMTNEHCIETQSTLDNSDFEFMAEGAECSTNCSFPLACPGTVEASGGILIRNDAPRDYALVMPSTLNHPNLADVYGYMRLRTSGAVVGERLYHPQHPAGWGKQIAVHSTYPAPPDNVDGYCHVNSLTEPACSSGGPQDVGYWTDTAGGSSGSPVLAYSDHKVVALHHCRGSNSCASGNPDVDDPNRGVPIDAVIAHLGDDLPPGAVCDQLDGPTGADAVANGDNRIDVSWNAIPSFAGTYEVRRSMGGCPQTAPQVIASGLTETTFVDATVSGGITYAYTIVGIKDDDGCASDPSDCVEATASGACIMPPDFDGLETVTNRATPECALELAWPAATANCGSSVVFNIYRSTTPGSTPDQTTLVESCLAGTQYVDTNVASGVDYFYVVRAEDDSGQGSGPCNGGNEDTNLEEGSGFATGPDEVFFADDMESETTNWIPAAGPNDGGGTGEWAQTTTRSHSPSHSWFCSDESRVKDQVLATAAAFDLSSAPAGALEFWHYFSTESGYDGGVLEYSVDNGATWHDILDGDGASIPANPDRFIQGGYNDTLSTSYSNPLPGRDAWSGDVSTWDKVVVDMADMGGYMVHLRWRLGCDSSVSGEGWYVDDVSVLEATDCGPAEPPLFADGFEAGDISVWGYHQP